jgi:hypothetical protein
MLSLKLSQDSHQAGNDRTLIFLFQQIEQHKCNKVGPRVFDCPNCDRTFPHQRPLEIHISNGWCHLGKRGGGNLAAAKLLANPGFERVTDESECAKRFKVLSGKEPNFFMLPAKRQNNVVVNAVAATTSSIETTLTSSTPTASSSATKKPVKFSISDRTIWSKFNVMTNHQTNEKVTPLEDLPETGSIFCGTKARGVNSEIRKEIKESKYNWKIRNLESGLPGSEILRAGNNFFLDSNFVSSHSDNDNNSDSDPGRKSGKENEENFDPKSEAVTSRTEDNSFVGIVSPIRIKTSEVKSESKKEKVSIKVILTRIPCLLFFYLVKLLNVTVLKFVGIFHRSRLINIERQSKAIMPIFRRLFT